MKMTSSVIKPLRVQAKSHLSLNQLANECEVSCLLRHCGVPSDRN
jgi:hypothetical protein